MNLGITVQIMACSENSEFAEPPNSISILQKLELENN